MKKISILLLMLAVAVPVLAVAKKLINVDSNGLALQGYDPVAFFTDGRPVKGDPQFESQYNGGRYFFASAVNKATFDRDPAKYEPQFGGFCAYAASRGYTAPIKVEAFQVLNDRLLMQYNFKARDKFNEDPQRNLKRADQNWLSIVEKHGK
jgi:YHS domain-containing protein